MNIKNISILTFLLIISACSSKPEPNLELFSPEAFAYDLGDYWEVNASVNAKGFTQNEVDEKFNAELSYSIDLITPESDSIIAIYDNIVNENSNEEVIDLALEAQLEVDSTFAEGQYKLIFHVKDELSNQNKIIEVKFNLER